MGQDCDKSHPNRLTYAKNSKSPIIKIKAKSVQLNEILSAYAKLT